MSDRTELEELRRLDALERKAAGTQPQQQESLAPYQPYQGIDPASDTERFGENPGTGKGGAEFLSRVGTGLADPIYGAAQLADKAINPIRQMVSPGASSMEDVIRERDQSYNAPEGFDAGRLVGNALNPVNYAGMSAPIRAGVIQAMAQPVSPDTENFATEKAKQAGIGAAGGVLSNALGWLRAGAKPTDAGLQFQKNINDSYQIAGSPPKPNLTPGQLAPESGWLRKMEQSIATVPFVGAPLRARQEDAMKGFQQFSRYAAMPKDEQGHVLDSFVQGFGGGRTINELERGFGSAYDDALNGIKVAVGRNSIDNSLILKSARELQQLESDLKKEGFRLAKSPALDSQEKGAQLLDQAKQLAELWRPQVAAQSPEAAAKLQFVDDAYGRFIPIQAASKKTNATLVTPENYTPAMVLKETRKAQNPETLYQGSVARQAEHAIGSVPSKTTLGGQLGLGGVGLASVLTGQHLPAAAAAALGAAYGTKPGQAVARGAQSVLTNDKVAATLEALRRGTVSATSRQKDE